MVFALERIDSSSSSAFSEGKMLRRTRAMLRSGAHGHRRHGDQCAGHALGLYAEEVADLLLDESIDPAHSCIIHCLCLFELRLQS